MRPQTRLPLPSAALAVALAAPLAAAQQTAPNDAGTGTLIGRVVDDVRCDPVGGARVRLVGSDLVATTDGGGRFRFSGLPAGERRVEALYVGFPPDTVRADVTAGALAYAEVRLTAVAADEGLMPVTTDGAGRTSPMPGAVRPKPRVTLVPARPTQGSVFRVRMVMPNDGEPPAATLGGQRLHFRRVSPRTYESLAPAPVDAPDSLTLAVGPARSGGALSTFIDADTIAVPIARGTFPVERLRVAPEFGRQPDLALAERLERESEKARDVGCRAHQTPRLWTEPFMRPRPGRVTSAFGRAREYNGTVTSRHTGTDFAGATGAPVYATNRGVVRLVDRFYLGGNVIYLDHGAGVVSAYMHLSQTAVAVGDTVRRGQVIGRVGSTGRVTGPHLHWVVRYGRVSVDPVTLLGVGGASAGAGGDE